MKSKYIFLAIALVCFYFANSQSTHPTINSVRVGYKYVSQSTFTTTSGSSSVMNTIPQATIHLNHSAQISKVYFKIMSTPGDSVLYTVNYNLNSGTITNTQGKKLFENNNGAVFISPGIPMTLKLYKFNITTEDSLLNLSPIFTTIK